MNLIGEHYGPVPNDETCVNYHHWEFNVKESDFFLIWKPTWQCIYSPHYTFQIGKEAVQIPANYYVMIGDVYGEIDFIRVDELIGREFEVFLMSSSFETNTWQIESISMIDYVEGGTTMYPHTKNPVPVMVGRDKAILISPVDLYNKMSSYTFADIV